MYGGNFLISKVTDLSHSQEVTNFLKKTCVTIQRRSIVFNSFSNCVLLIKNIRDSPSSLSTDVFNFQIFKTMIGGAKSAINKTASLYTSDLCPLL